MKKLSLRTWFSMLLSISVLIGCGGGSGDSSARETGSSDWGSMVWDRDNWS